MLPLRFPIARTVPLSALASVLLVFEIMAAVSFKTRRLGGANYTLGPRSPADGPPA